MSPAVAHNAEQHVNKRKGVVAKEDKTGKCIRPFAQAVGKILKFRSAPLAKGQYTVGIASAKHGSKIKCRANLPGTFHYNKVCSMFIFFNNPLTLFKQSIIFYKDIVM